MALLLGCLVNTKTNFIGFGEKIKTVVIITNDCVMTFILAFSEFIGSPLIAKAWVQALAIIDLDICIIIWSSRLHGVVV